MLTAVGNGSGILDLDGLRAAITAHEQAGATIALAAARLDREGTWASSGAVSMKAWMRDHCRLSNTSAGRWLSHGRFLHTFDAFADAATAGVLAGGHIDAIRTAVTAEHETLMTEHQGAIVEALAPLPIGDAETVCASWRAKADAINPGNEPKPPRRDLTYTTAADGAVVGRFDLDGPVGTEFLTAIDTALAWNGDDEFRLPGHQRADALFDICAFYNANHTKSGTPRHRPHIELSITLDQLDTLSLSQCADNSVLAGPTTEAFLCDSVIHRVTRAGSAVLDYGRSTRIVALDLFRAVAARDRGCRYPGCDRKVAWCEAHHIRHWRHGGPTSLDNLALLCTPPPSHPHSRLADQAPPRCHRRDHHSQWAHPHEPTARPTPDLSNPQPRRTPRSSGCRATLHRDATIWFMRDVETLEITRAASSFREWLRSIAGESAALRYR